MHFVPWSSSSCIPKPEVCPLLVITLPRLILLGKSLEEIDEIFGDVKIVHEEDVRFSEKAGVDVMERRDSRVVQQ